MAPMRQLTALLLATQCGLALPALADNGAYRLHLDDAGAYRLQIDRTSATESGLAGRPYATEIAAAARESDLDPALVHAVIQVESAYQAAAVSPKGALGLMQVLPETARRFGVDNPRDPAANLRAGTRYLRALLDRFDQRTDLALAAYNAGEGAVLRHAGTIPPYPETRRYVPAVLGHWSARSVSASQPIHYAAGTRLDKPTVGSANSRMKY